MSLATDNRRHILNLRSIDDLAFAYARILEAVWSMPTFGRGDSQYVVLSSDQQSPWVKRLGWPGLLLWWLRIPFIPLRNWWRSFLIRPVVSFYATVHINGNASKLHSALVRRRLESNVDDGISDDSLDDSIAGLERLKTVTTGWVALLVLLRFVPLVGLLFSMGLVTVSFTLANTGSIVENLIGVMAAVMFIVHPIAVQFGFRWKRALFAGGGSGGEGEDLSANQLPNGNVYQLEKQVFSQSRLKRVGELPVDLLLAPGYFFLFNMLIGLISGTTSFDSDATSTESVVGNIIFAGVFVTFFVMATARLVLRYKLRRASGDC